MSTTRSRSFRLGALLAAVALWSAHSAGGQQAPSARIVDVALSSDTVGIGDRFAITVSLSLPAGSVAFVPDSLMAIGFEPFAPVEWTSTDSEDGGVDLAVTYPLIAFQVGPVEVPDFEVFTALATESVNAGLSATGAVVGSWDNLQRGGAVPSMRMHVVPPRELWVASVFQVEDVAQGVRPRPTADVVGGNRDWPATLLMMGFGLVLLSVATISVQEWRERANRIIHELADPRAAALLALDQLLAEGHHRSGRIRDFYARSSEIVRRFVEGLEQAWGPSYTSTELMRSLSEAVGGTDNLVVEMFEAEVVKFSTTRPEEATAEEHWRVLRNWVSEREPPSAEGIS